MLRLSLLVLLVLPLPPRPAAGLLSAPPPVVAVGAVQPSRIPVDGLTEVIISLSPASGTGSSSSWGHASAPACRLSAITSTSSCHAPAGRCGGSSGGLLDDAVSFDRPSATGYTAPARVLNITHLACTPPAVPVEGLAVLSVSPDNTTWSAAPDCLQFISLFSASVSRRPYFSEAEGALLVTSDTMLADDSTLWVSAELLEYTPPITLVAPVHIQGATRVKLAFDLRSLPARVSTTVTIRLHIGTTNQTIVKTRQFERVATAAVAINGSDLRAMSTLQASSAVDHETGALLVDNQPFLLRGMYISTGNILVGSSMVNMTPSQHNPGFGALLGRLAKGGLNTAMIYQASQLPPSELAALLDELAVVGIRVLFEMTEIVAPLLVPGGNTSASWARFVELINAVKGSPSILGYYICDDCTGMATRQDPSAKLTNWDNCLAMAAVYSSLRELDPYHLTFGAVQTSDLWSFSDGPGALSIDVSLIENYATSLQSHTAGHERSLRRWPMDASILVNCLWMSNSWWSGPWGPRQLNSATFAGAAAAGLYHNLFFALEDMTEEELVASVLTTSTELAELAPAFFSSSVQSPPDPVVSVSATADIAELLATFPPSALLGGNSSGGVVAHAWSEPPSNGDAEPFCIFVVSVNPHAAPAFVNLSFSGMVSHSLARKSLVNLNG
jgi:hypothetical protein